MSSDQPSRPPVPDPPGEGGTDAAAGTAPVSGASPAGGSKAGSRTEPEARLETERPAVPETDPGTGAEAGAESEPADPSGTAADAGEPGSPQLSDPDAEPAAAGTTSTSRRRRRDPLAAALIGVLTLVLGFAIAVQVRNTDADQQLAGAREEDLVRILDELNAREDRIREQIAEQRSALQQLNGSDSRSATALEEARRRAEAIGILNGTVAARGPGLEMVIDDPEGEVRVADVLDAIQELRGAGAETMQIDGVRVGVSTAVTGDPGALMVDGRRISSPYQFLVIGSPQNMETAMNIPGGVVQRITGRGGSVRITQSQQVVVGALRPLDRPQYASPETGD